MKKIMIVDDEVLVRIGIKSMTVWEDYGYTIVGDAAGGEEAMEKIRKLRPQIVLTDLMMHPMDGFQLISRCAREYPEIRFVVLSNYNDFENVRRAMKLGACDYVFKLTIHVDELVKVLDEVSAELEEGAGWKKNADNVTDKNRELLKNGLFGQALNKEKVFLGHVARGFESLSLQVDFNRSYIILSVQIDSLPVARKRGDFLETDLLMFAIGNIMEELMQRNCLAEVFLYHEFEFAVVINREEGQTPEDFQSMLELRFQTLVKYIRQYFGFGISGAISSQGKGVHHLRQAVSENQGLLKERFFLESGMLLYGAVKNCEELEIADEFRTAALENLLKQSNFYSVTSRIRELLDFLETRKSCKAEDIRRRLRMVNKTLTVFLTRYQIEIDTIYDSHGMNLEEAVDGYTFFRDLKTSVLELLEKYEQLTVGKGKNGRKEIEQVKQFVQKNLEAELTISMAAEMIGMSESRFSHVFKEAVGTGFMEYVNALRIEKVTELLRDTDLRVNEIAERVGIVNPNYLSAQYKKRTGFSPNEFRKNLSMKDFKRQ